MSALHRSLLLLLLTGLIAGCAGRRPTGTAREARIGNPEDLISHVELTISGLNKEDAERIERQFKSEGYLKNALLRSYVSGKAVYEMDVRGCECDLPERLGHIPHPGLRYEGRTTRIAYSAFDNEPPSINLVHPPLWKVLDEAEPYILVEVPGADVARVEINHVPAERFRGDIYRARVHLDEKTNTLQVVATDTSGNEGKLERRIQVDTSPAMVRAVSRLTVEGHVEPGSVLLVDGREVPVDAQGRYRAEVRVQRGQRTVELVALDAQGHKTVILRPLDEGRP